MLSVDAANLGKVIKAGADAMSSPAIVVILAKDTLPAYWVRCEFVTTDFLLGRSQRVRLVSCAWPAGQLEGPMSLLVDNQIRDRIMQASSLAPGVVLTDFTGSESRIQAAPLDLTVGDIPPNVLDCIFRRLLLRPGFLSHLRSLRLR
jgi:hypothetical protein